MPKGLVVDEVCLRHGCGMESGSESSVKTLRIELSRWCRSDNGTTVRVNYAGAELAIAVTHARRWRKCARIFYSGYVCKNAPCRNSILLVY